MYNMKFPPSIKFFGEIFSFLFIKNLKSWLIWLVLLTVFLGGLFKIYAFMALRHGKRRQNYKKKLKNLFYIFIIILHLAIKGIVIR